MEDKGGKTSSEGDSQAILVLLKATLKYLCQ